MRPFSSIASTCPRLTLGPLNHICIAFRDWVKTFSISMTIGRLPVTSVPTISGHNQLDTNYAWAHYCTVSLRAIWWPYSPRPARQRVALNDTMVNVIRRATSKSACSMATSACRPRATRPVFSMRLIILGHYSTIAWATRTAGALSTFRCWLTSE